MIKEEINIIKNYYASIQSTTKNGIIPLETQKKLLLDILKEIKEEDIEEKYKKRIEFQIKEEIKKIMTNETKKMKQQREYLNKKVVSTVSVRAMEKLGRETLNRIEEYYDLKPMKGERKIKALTQEEIEDYRKYGGENHRFTVGTRKI